jgi:hypothetical protein
MTAITNTYQQQIDIIKKESQEYGIRVGQAKLLEEELNQARMIFSILKFPSEAKNLPSDFAPLLLEAAKLCYTKGMNPTISIVRLMTNTVASLHLGCKRVLKRLLLYKWTNDYVA